MDRYFLITTFKYICTAFGVVFFVASLQFKDKKNILLVQSIAALFYALSYIFVGAFSGYTTELTQMIKNLVFYNYEKKNKKTPLVLLVLFILALISFSLIGFNGIYSLAPLFINLAYFISSYFRNPKHIRITVLICAFIWIYYNFKVGTYIIILGNIFEIISASISIIRYKKKP